MCWLSWHNFKDDFADFLHFVARGNSYLNSKGFQNYVDNVLSEEEVVYKPMLCMFLLPVPFHIHILRVQAGV